MEGGREEVKDVGRKEGGREGIVLELNLKE